MAPTTQELSNVEQNTGAAEQTPGPYAAAGNPHLQSPTLQRLGFRIAVFDMIAAWEKWEWQNFAAFVAALVLFKYVGGIRDQTKDLDIFVRLRVFLCWVLFMSWIVEMLYRVTRQDSTIEEQQKAAR